MGRLTLFTLLLWLVWTAGLSAQAPQGAPDQPSARRGRFLYQQNCAPCHGDLGKGDGPVASQTDFKPTDFTEPTWWPDKTPQGLFQITKEGRLARQMPPWKDRLTDAEIWDVVFYVWSLHTTAEEYRAGEEKYVSLCAGCHGRTGKGSAGVPDLSDLAATAGRSQRDWEEVLITGVGGHPTYADLPERDRMAVLEFVRAFSYRSPFAPTPSGKGIISGVVTNGTPGGNGVANLTVTLHIFEGELESETRTTSTDEQGRYRFEGLSTDPDLAYAATVDYKGVPYGSDLIPFPEGSTELSLPIQVYETTEDGSGVRIARAHLIMDFEPGNLLIGELYFLSNAKDRTFVGTEGASGRALVLRFTLPQGATDLDINGEPLGSRFVATANGFADTLPLPPGENVRQILFRYSLPYTAPRLRLLRELNYDAANVNVLVADRGVAVTSPQLTPAGTRGTQGQTYLNFVGSNLRAGQALELNFSGLPMAGRSPARALTNSPLSLAVGLGLGALMMGGLLAYALVLRRPPPQTRTPASPPARATLHAQRQRLLTAIARLDDDFEAGKVAEATYRQERTALKAQLLEVARRMQDEENT